MSDRVVIDRLVVLKWIEKTFLTARSIDRVGYNYEEDQRDARAFWLNHYDQIMRDLEKNSIVLPRSDDVGN